MSASPHTPEKLPLRAAFEAGDHAAVVAAFAPDAVLRSPITGRMVFRGRDQIGALARVLLDELEDLRYTAELRSGQDAVLLARARIAGTDVELADHLRLDENGEIRELTVFFRPMPAIAVAARALGTGLARRRSRTRGKIVSLLVAPLVVLVRMGDALGAWLVRPGP